MTVSVLPLISGPYSPNGATTAYPFYFKAMAPAQVTAYLIDLAGTATVIDPDDYVVTLSATPPYEGGVLTTDTALPADGSVLWIVSEPSYEQQVAFEDEGPFSAETLNDPLDLATIRDNVLKAQVERTLHVRPWDDALAPLPIASVRAGGVQSYDQYGQPTILDYQDFADQVSALLSVEFGVIDQGTISTPKPIFHGTSVWDDGLNPGDVRPTFNAIVLDIDASDAGGNNYHTAFELNDTATGETVISMPFIPLYGASYLLFRNPSNDEATYPNAFFGIGINGGVGGLVHGNGGNARPSPVISYYWEDSNIEQVAVLSTNALNRLAIESLSGAMVHISFNSRYEWEGPGAVARISHVGYYNADGKTNDWNNAGQPGGTTVTPVSASTVTHAVNVFEWCFLASSTWTPMAWVDGNGYFFAPGYTAQGAGGVVRGHSSLVTADTVMRSIVGINAGNQGFVGFGSGAGALDALLTRTGAGVLSLTGDLLLANAPTVALHPVTKAYADANGHTVAMAAPRTAVTGTLVETTVATIVLPAGWLGPNGQLRIEAAWSGPSNANTKTMRAYFGGNGVLSFPLPANVASAASVSVVANTGATNAQVAGGATGTGFAGTTAAPATLAVDTTAAVTILLTIQLGNVGDTVKLDSYRITAFYGA